MLKKELHGGVAVITLEHGPVNATDTAALRAITAEFSALNGPDGPAAVVFTGSGRAFSAGVDLRAMLAGGPPYLAEFLPALDEACLALFTLDKPMVAAVNGHAIAGGCVLACCADLRVMASGRGRIGVPEIKVGVPFPRVPLEMLVHAVGPKVAQRLVYRADTVTPEEALTLGLVDEVVEPEALLERSIALAAELAERAPADTFAMSKWQLRRDGLDRIARYQEDEHERLVSIWERRTSDSWTADYLAAATRRS